MCGRKRKADEMVQNWQGLYRCPEHNEARQPQDFVRVIPDVMSVPWSQPETNQYTTFCTFNGLSAIPGLALPGCSIPGRAIFNIDFDPIPEYLTTDSGELITTDDGEFIVVTKAPSYKGP